MKTKVIFRDRNGWLIDGFEFSSPADDNALQIFDKIIFEFFTGKPFEDGSSSSQLLRELKDLYPDFLMGKILRYAMLADTSVLNDIKLRLEKGLCTEFEKLHCEAVLAHSKHENPTACEIWSKLLLSYPKDLIALKLTYFLYFSLGNSNMLRNLISRSLPHFEKKDRYYGYLLNRLAFGLEETNAFELADKTVKEGLALVPDDYWGIHTQAHVYESLCKYEEGIKFLEDTEDLWKNQFLACHTYWHLCLFYVELGNYTKAIEIFDEKMKPKILQEKSYLGAADGVQLLYRLEFNDFNVGERWEDIYTASHSLQIEHCDALYVTHLYLSFLKSNTGNNDCKAMKFLDKLQKHADETGTHNTLVIKRLVFPILHAFTDHFEKKYAEAVESIYLLKEKFIELGGSNSQRDFFELFLIDSCLRSNEGSVARVIGKQFLHERLFLKPGSTMTKKLMEKM